MKRINLKSSFIYIILMVTLVCFACVEKDDGNKPDTSGTTNISDEPVVEVCDSSITDQFGGGSGSQEDPYLVCNAKQLQYINDHMKKLETEHIEVITAPLTYIKQTKDIDLSGINFAPICIDEFDIGFYAKVDYNGANYKISNLEILDNTSNNVGLFSLVGESKFRNIILDNVVSVKGNAPGANVGTLIGRTYEMVGNVYLENIHIRAKDDTSIVQAPNGTAGGIIGTLDSSFEPQISINLSSSDIDVNGFTNVGGLVGHLVNEASTRHIGIYRSYCTGDISASGDAAGGIVGYMGMGGKVVSSYSTGDVSAADSAGGLIGMGSTTENYIYASYSIGDVSITSTLGRAGGIVGFLPSHLAFENIVKSCYVTGQVYKGGALYTNNVLVGNDPLFERANVIIEDSFNASGTDDDTFQVATLETIIKSATNTDYFDVGTGIDFFPSDLEVRITVSGGEDILDVYSLDDAWGVFTFDNNTGTLPQLQ